MTKWEYTTLDCTRGYRREKREYFWSYFDKYDELVNKDTLEDVLNDYGKLGWEVIFTNTGRNDGQPTYEFLFKREVKDDN